MTDNLIRSWIVFTCRTALGTTYLVTGLHHTTSNLLRAGADTLIQPDVSDPFVNLCLIVLSGILIMVAIWLLFGVRSRVVAAIGLAMAAGIALSRPGAITEAVALGGFFLSIPIMMLGGGRYAIYRRGNWQDVI